jgi:hypothetical protein
MDGAMQTLWHKRPDPIGALGTARAFVAQRCNAALESVRTAIREKLKM